MLRDLPPTDLAISAVLKPRGAKPRRISADFTGIHSRAIGDRREQRCQPEAIGFNTGVDDDPIGRREGLERLSKN